MSLIPSLNSAFTRYIKPIEPKKKPISPWRDHDQVKDWLERLDELDEFLILNKKLPHYRLDQKLSKWTRDQNYTYNKRNRIMRRESIRCKWESFLLKHEVVFSKYGKKICELIHRLKAKIGLFP